MAILVPLKAEILVDMVRAVPHSRLGINSTHSHVMFWKCVFPESPLQMALNVLWIAVRTVSLKLKPRVTSDFTSLRAVWRWPWLEIDSQKKNFETHLTFKIMFPLTFFLDPSWFSCPSNCLLFFSHSSLSILLSPSLFSSPCDVLSAFLVF